MNIELFAGGFMALVACLIVPIFVVDALRDAGRWRKCRRPTSAQLTRWIQARAWRVALPVLAMLFLCSLVLGPESIAAQLIKGGVGKRVTAGPFVDTATAATPNTALAITQADVWLFKNGAAPATKNQADSSTHSVIGFYPVSLNSTDTNTDGTLDIAIKMDDCLIVWRHMMVIDGVVYDADVTGSDYRKIDLAQIQGTAPTTTSAGKMSVGVTHWKATAVATHTAGYPAVTVKDGVGAGEIDTTSGRVGITGLVDASAAKLDDILDGTGGTGLTLNSLIINGNAAGGTVDIDNAGGPGVAVNGSTLGVDIEGAAGHGLNLTGTGANKRGLNVTSSAGDGIRVTAGGDGNAVQLIGSGHGNGLYVVSGTTGYGMEVVSLADTAVHIEATDGDGIVAIGAGVGHFDINADIHGTLDTVTTLTNWNAVTLANGAHGGAAASLTLGAGLIADITGNLSGSVGSLTTWDKTGYSIADATSDAVIADAVWNAATVTYGVAGSYGLVFETNINATIASRSDHTAANVWAVGARTLTAATNITSTGGTTFTQTGDSFALANGAAGFVAIKADTAATLADTGTTGVIVSEITAAALADMFNTDSGTTYAASVAGSVVKEIADNAAAGGGDATAANQTTMLAVLQHATYGNAALRTRGDIAWITGGGGATWTAAEKNQIRTALGLTGTLAATSGAGNLDQVFKIVQGGGP